MGTSTITLSGTVAVVPLGASNTAGASINGGTLALNTYNSQTGVTRTFIIGDTGNTTSTVDLDISAAIVDGTGFAAASVTKNGLGEMQFSGASPNTYSGTTTVNDGALTLNKSANVSAMSGPLVIGDGAL